MVSMDPTFPTICGICPGFHDTMAPLPAYQYQVSENMLTYFKTALPTPTFGGNGGATGVRLQRPLDSEINPSNAAFDAGINPAILGNGNPVGDDIGFLGRSVGMYLPAHPVAESDFAIGHHASSRPSRSTCRLVGATLNPSASRSEHHKRRHPTLDQIMISWLHHFAPTRSNACDPDQ